MLYSPIPSLEGEVIEEYGIKVAEAWKIGWKGKDNGVIFLVAKQDRKMRIEVGRGLEGKLTDLTAGRIVDLVVKPRFKRGDFDGGVVSGVHAVIDATRGEFKADEQRHWFKNVTVFQAFYLCLFSAQSSYLFSEIYRVFSGGIAGAVGLPLLAVSTFASAGLIAIVILAVAGLAAGIFLPLLFSSGRHGSWPGGGFYTGGRRRLRRRRFRRRIQRRRRQFRRRRRIGRLVMKYIVKADKFFNEQRKEKDQ